tara:strand:+ start:1546 stop:2481 length:936 start_codon:yes stop_codon:yes gene_type:complete
MSRDFAAYAKSTYKWKPGHEKYLRITKSSLTSDFDFCPKQYEFKRIEGRKQPETDDMRRGTNVHDAMELFFVNVKPSVDKILALAKQGKDEEAFGLMWRCLPVPEKEYVLDEEPILQTRLEWEYARLIESDGKNYLPIMNEEEVHAFFSKKVTVNGEEYNIPIHMVGMIDRGFQTEGNTVALMELKTGKWKVNDSYKPRSMRTEMAFYAELLKKADHPYQNVTHWGWLFPAGDRLGLEGTAKHWDYETINKRYFNSIDKKINNLIEAYIIENFPPVPSQGKCAWCPWMEDCPAWQEGGDKYWKQIKGRHKK